jgi:hypothetical protein
VKDETESGRESQIDRRRRLSAADKKRLLNAVNAVPTMRKARERETALRELRAELGDKFNPTQGGSTATDNFAIVSACIQCGALPSLVEVLELLGGKSAEWQQLDAVVRELVPSDEEIDDQIRSCLESVTADTLASVLGNPLLEGKVLFSDTEVSNGAEAYVRLSAESNQRGQRAVLIFLELTAHQLFGQYASFELHRLIDDLARRSDDTHAIRDICRSLQPTHQKTDPDAGEAEQTDSPVSANENKDHGDHAVKTIVAPTGPSVATLPPQVWGGVPPRNNNFTGRQDLLDEIHRSLNDNLPSALVAQPIHGLGGVGKSQVAVEFAYRNQFDYQLVWWVQADDERSIRRSLASLSRRLELPETADVQDTVDTALDALRRGNPHSRWLLIYDNAPEPSVVRPYLPSGQGHVLITSRTRTWASEANAIEVDVFTPDESVALLRERWKELTEQTALLLAEQLGHLPLALEQAVAVHKQTGMPLSEYLRALKHSPRSILYEGAPTNYPQSVAHTFGLAYESLKKTSTVAAHLLELCAFLSSQPIAIPLLIRGRGTELPPELQTAVRDDIQLRRAVRDLGRYALAQLDAGRDFIKIHSLVRAVLRDSIPTEQREAMQYHAHAVLATANPGFPDDPSTWAQHAQIAPHVVPSGLIYSPDPDARRLILDQIRYLYAIGDYATSRDFGREALNAWRASMGPDDATTLVASRHLANSLRALGYYNEARDLNQDTLARMVRTLGQDHEHTLATSNSVAADLRFTGDFGKALELDEENLSRHRSILGEDDPSTLRVMTNLAVDHRLLGDFQRALDLDEDNLERKSNIYGEEHPSTFHSFMCKIRDLYGLGEYRQGLGLVQEKLPFYEKRLPKSHVDLLVAKRNLAMFLRKAGHHDVAVREAQEVYQMCRAKFGRLHEHTLSALVTLSNTLRVVEDHEAALSRGQNALASYREVFGDQHPLTLACMVDVAILLRLLGHNDDARVLNDKALVGLRGTLGADHPHTLCAANSKVNELAIDDRIDEARSLGEENLDRSRRVRGDRHPNTLACAINLSLDLEAAGEVVSASQLRRQTLDLFRRQLGSDHPDTISVGLYVRMECDIEVPAL